MAVVAALGFVAFRGGKEKSETSSGGSEVVSTPGQKTAEHDGPVEIIDENFKTSLENNQALPPGWKGEALGVVADGEGRACLEVNKKTGEHLVTLPPLSLGAGFVIEVEYILHGLPANRGNLNQSLTFQLASSRGGEGIPIAINHAGFVAIAGNEPRQAAGFPVVDMFHLKDVKISRLHLVRNGKTLRVELNGVIAASAQIDENAVFDRLQIGLTAGHVPNRFAQPPEGYTAKLYSLKIGPLSK